MPFTCYVSILFYFLFDCIFVLSVNHYALCTIYIIIIILLLLFQVRISLVCSSQTSADLYVSLRFRTGLYFLAKRDYTLRLAMAWQIRLSICLSVVCDVRAPYSGGLTFRRQFCTTLQYGHPATHPPKITKIVQGDHPNGGR